MNPIEIYRRTPERDQILRPHRSHVPPEQIRQSLSEEIPKHADTPMYEYCGEFRGNCAVSAAAADGRIGGNDDPVHFPVDPDTVTGNKLIPPHPVNDLVDLVPELCRVDRGE